MNTHADQIQESKRQSVSVADSKIQSSSESIFQFVDNRPEFLAHRNLQEIANNSIRGKQYVQLQAMADNYSNQQQQPLQKKGNNTYVPGNLKSGIENLLGYSLDDSKKHYSSDKPTQLYRQGSNIQKASGQGKHLPHEGLHVVQRMVQVGKKNIKRTVLVAAIKKGIKQSLIPDAYTQKVQGNVVLDDDKSAGAIDKLMKVYSSMTIHLTDFNSLIHQASQDLHMLAQGNESLIGIGHQHSEFTYKRNSTDRSKKDITFKSGLLKDNQRVYRTMTLEDWENNHISGHGGSIGQAMHYFNLGKKAHTQDNQRKPDLLVEFTFTGKKLSELTSGIEGDGEGKKSTDDSFGGKTEQNTAFGLSHSIFSVDLKNASGLLSKNFVSAKVLASTNDELPEQIKKGKSAEWFKRPS